VEDKVVALLAVDGAEVDEDKVVALAAVDGAEVVGETDDRQFDDDKRRPFPGDCPRDNRSLVLT
jgi:hypothetical protein